MTNKWAMITGASSGIGEATAKKLAIMGYSLILQARRKDRLERLAQDLGRQFSNQSFSVACFDLQKRSAVLEYVEKNKSLLAGLSILVNNAGLAKGTEKIQEAHFSDWEQMIDTNVKGLLSLTREILPSMIANHEGHIVNIGSVAGRYVYPGGAVYCASKFAVRAISEGLRMDLLGTPIRVSNIEPGMVQTEFSLVRFQDPAKAKAVYDRMQALTADDIAETISWVISRPRHVNIQELVIFPTDQAAVGQVARYP